MQRTTSGGILGECWLVLVLGGLLIGIVGAERNMNDYIKREHSLIKPYHGSGMTIPYWNFQGNTLVTNNFVRLTADAQSQRGTIWNTVPCHVRNWELQVSFKVYGKGKDLFGDGLAIWYAKDPNQPGPVFGSKDYFNGLVVILDTYSNHNGEHNHQHPYISAMVNNGTLHYDHDRDGTHTQLAGCEAKFRNLEHDTYISLRYEKDTLTVSTDFSNKGAWKECFTVKEIQLPTGYYFGVTATTGDLSDNHAVVSLKLYQLDSPDDVKDRSQIVPSAAYFESPRDHVEDPKPSSLGGIKIFFLMLIGALALIACVVIGIMLYQKHQEQSRKRFY
ncbi:vesicular integral-membrane protein VIP36 isoform X2 [Copidosoma floridanum]|uniref:vesicular integral-membrane protein VIP36 isoform X2 n=1 Tax=Copidosoma floridanum TaxID=29053 RepID=UPI000C6F57BD|nr:vesicular integral-membrane protein VIP36 isoform X2 [Copidosoma floridanum]